MLNRDNPSENKPSAPSPAPLTSATPGRPAEERRLVAWVGKSLVFRGDLIGSEDMIVEGRVEGSIELRENALTVGVGGHVQADITAKTVTIHGTVIGTIVATETVFIAETGSVEGNVTSHRLAVADGAVIKGHITAGAKPIAANTPSTPQLNAVASR